MVNRIHHENHEYKFLIEDAVLLGRYSASTGKQVPTFRGRAWCLHLQGLVAVLLDDGGSTILRNVGTRCENRTYRCSKLLNTWNKIYVYSISLVTIVRF